jgi:hypothetical protein
LSANDYGFDGLVTAMIPALGDTGTAHLKNRLAQVLADRPKKAGGRDLNYVTLTADLFPWRGCSAAFAK